ncbi:MAG: YhcG family protein [Candidatus Berkiellales bacterium]
MKKKLSSISTELMEPSRAESLYKKVSNHIDNARQVVQRSIDIEMVKAYWHIGRDIVEEEQHGKERAEYGQAVLQTLSVNLKQKYKSGYSVDTLERIRKFYLLYQEDMPASNSAPLVRKSEKGLSARKSAPAVRNSTLPFLSHNLSWTHYLLLIRIRNPQARKFYELETSKNNWSSKELRRQIGSMLFDRLLKTKDEKELLRLACKGQEINNPEDAIKEPLVLEFLGLPERYHKVESKVEKALINNLQQFLLELGKGFAFVARQKRLTLESDTFFADLVMYHYILKCFAVIDIKTHELTHADLGQMQLYVNYFDKEIKMENDNPTIGLILCTERNETVVKYMLGEKAKQIFAKTYQFHLPTEAELERELKREIEAIQHKEADKNEGKRG